MHLAGNAFCTPQHFFKLLHNEGAISLAVHRVGDSLVLEGLEAAPWARGVGEPAEGIEPVRMAVG